MYRGDVEIRDWTEVETDAYRVIAQSYGIGKDCGGGGGGGAKSASQK